MKKSISYILVSLLLICSFVLSFGTTQAVHTETTVNNSEVNSISLVGENSKIEWETDGYSKNGFKIVCQKNHNYPIRAVDLPVNNPIIDFFLRFLISIVFFLSKPMNLGMHQTVICKRFG